MMKLSVLLLPALLALSSASLQDIVKKSAQHRKVPFLNPDLGNRVPQITTNGSVLPLLTPAEFEKRLGQSSSYMFSGSNLEWQTMYGSDPVPSGAVYIHNEYVGGRIDYVCKYRCSSGFYNPGMGLHCHYPLSGKENEGNPFEILVNKGYVEDLYWQFDFFGGVRPNSVQTCSGLDLYVGKNKYGLGKVQQSHGAFFLPWEGDEYWYKYYEVLVINKNVISEHMSNVVYNTDVKTIALPPEIVTTSDITNNECSSVVKTVELSGTNEEERRWDTSIATTKSSSITAQIPVIGTSIGFSSETTEQFSRGETKVTSKTYSVSVEVTVPPNHSCSVSMVGHKYKANIPFTAHLKRTYSNGRIKSAYISGVFYGVNVGRVQSVVDRCEPVPNAQPCSERERDETS